MGTLDHQNRTLFQRFLATESAGGYLLMGSAVLALLVANSPLAPYYFGTLSAKLAGISVLHWINDGLMVLFFLLVGLEIKRELLIGQLRSWPDRVLPGIAAAGGMVVPALIFVVLNLGSDVAMRGWAIPAATDIAFALGVLSLFGKRVPSSLKVFLTALAILDDLGAILIIALFYTATLSLPMALAAFAVVVVLAVMNRMGVKRLSIYLGLGLVLWVLVLKSGVHATVAGVLLAMTIPLSAEARSDGKASGQTSALHRLEHGLAPWSGFLVLPVFGFANAGVSLAGLANYVFDPVTLGVALGLLIGKQLGIFGSVWLCIVSRLAKRPHGAKVGQIYGISLLCGIGFTMSLFIGELAYPGFEQQMNATKIGVLAGSLLAALAGWVVLNFTSKQATEDASPS